MLILTGGISFLRTIVVIGFAPSIRFITCLDTPLGPAFSPFNAVLLNPVMRTAWKAPVANGRPQRHAVAIKNKLPVGWGEWSHDFASTTTAAEMHDSAVGNGNIDDFFVEEVRDAFDEFMIECGH